MLHSLTHGPFVLLFSSIVNFHVVGVVFGAAVVVVVGVLLLLLL